MEQYTDTAVTTAPRTTKETSIFEETAPLPVYYSERAVYVFSVICGALFGSVLMAMNFKNTPQKKGVWQVILFGVLFTAIQITIGAYLPKNTGSVWVLSIVGGRVLNYWFWNKYIGTNVNYTKRSVVAPTIIGVVLILAIIAVVILAVAAEDLSHK